MTRELPGFAGAVQRRLRTTVAKRFSRFTVAAAAALGTNQITLTICLGPLRWTAGRSAITAWAAAAAVSYLVSRWAWERKGRPNVLKETLPFWMVSIGAAIVLTTATKFANQQAISMGLGHTRQVLFDDAANLLANCVTFLTRFVIFHYVLFADRKKVRNTTALAPASSLGEPCGPVSPSVPTGSAAPVGAVAGAHSAGSPMPESGTPQASENVPAGAETGSLPELGTQR